MYFNENALEANKNKAVIFSLIYVKNFDLCRKPNSLILALLEETGFDLEKIFFFSSLGRWCSEFLISESYGSLFTEKIQGLSDRFSLPEQYAISVDQGYNPLLPQSYDYLSIRYELPSLARKVLELNSRHVASIHYSNVIDSTSDLQLKTFFSKLLASLKLENLALGQNSTYQLCPSKKNENKQNENPDSKKRKEKNVDSIKLNLMKSNWNTLTEEHIAAMVPEMQQYRLIVYTDGAYVHYSSARYKPISTSTTQNYTAGIGVFFSNEKHGPIYEKLDGVYSSARAELIAVQYALKRIISNMTEFSEYHELWFCLDSRYVIDGINSNFKKWMVLDNKNSRGKKIANFDLFQKINDLCSILTVNNFSLFFHYLPSHSGIKGNEISNLLAKAATLI
ncbi:hypothetical protein BB560_003748 [Smittium megazygosporum]|uniref:ribonuclease H n=1 Tax=Smittium megazygosporum TaxID=133381 RepID=A0A2T9ZB34_9FUNG|nr:hypothetical protein BB560_003748 [Smittium megazygosporum]